MDAGQSAGSTGTASQFGRVPLDVESAKKAKIESTPCEERLAEFQRLAGLQLQEVRGQIEHFMRELQAARTIEESLVAGLNVTEQPRSAPEPGY